MQQASALGTTATQQRSDDLTRLIRKLRWIGLEEEARCLQEAARAVPADEREAVLNGPPSTD